MQIFANLLLGHLLADFPLQTSPIFRWKMKSINGVVFHGFIHFLITALLFLPDLKKVAGVLLILFVVHVLQDQTKVKTGGKQINTPVPFLSDQLIHLVILGIASVLPPFKNAHTLLSASQAWIGSGFIAATFVGTILFFTLAQSLPSERQDVGITWHRKALDFIEHGALFGAVLTGWYWLAALIYLLKIFFWKKQIGGPYYSAWMELCVSPLWAVLLAILVKQMIVI
jgi:hypothetical protein